MYSLVEDETFQNAITKLNMNNSNITINYQIGVPEGTGVDTSDAIKKLNTEIMAGKGPDILLLDNLPVDSYIENEVLADIKDIVTTDKNIFHGLIEAYKKDGSIYQFPLKISLPVIIGNKDLLKEANDLNSLLTVIKEYSSQTDSRIFEYLGSPEEFIYNFYFIFENGWINKNNKINKNNLTNFLEICAEIYKISKEKDDIYKEQMYDDYVNQMKSLGLSENETENGYSEISSDGNRYMNSININGMSYYKNKPLFALDSIDTPYQFEALYNLMLRDSSITYEILKNNEESIFYPKSKIGINNKSKNIKLAKEILSNIINSNVYSGNLTPNKEQITNSLLIDDISNEYEYNSENNHYLKMIQKDIDSDGMLIETPIYWLNENDINDINLRIDKIDTERETNMVLISEVAKQFTEMIEKNLKPKDVTDKIIDNIEIYLSE
ncbi:ABC transporter substrate-binding protein [Clostridium sp.]|uniref:ABC transporter substrate-binding protein n=1 Tax=Clostridium sp. TaxID=1506 RepID=UPI00345BE7C2